MSKPKSSKKRPKKQLPLPTVEHELRVGAPIRIVVGIDEVGRGCLAGPVVAGAVVLPEHWLSRDLGDLRKEHAALNSITDSKLIAEDKRGDLATWIRSQVRAFGVGHASVEEIDSINIFQASLLAMKRAIEELELKSGIRCEHVLIDGSHIHPAYRSHCTAIVKGDLHSLSISCAAIIAKVHRDEWMARLAAENPGYGFENHKGYAVPSHYRAVLEKGPSPIHRRSFSPIKDMIQAGIKPAQGDLF